MLTNLATPIGTAYVISVMSTFGDSAVAGMSVIGRITPVALAIVFAVSGAVGPIIGQNLGAGKFERVRETLKSSLLFISGVVTVVSLILFALTSFFISVFQLGGEAATLMRTFTTFIAITYIFVGAGFVANAAFNNLGKSTYALVVNILKATVFTIPFVYFGAQYFGSVGVIVGQALGGAIIGIAAYLFAMRYIRIFEEKQLSKS